MQSMSVFSDIAKFDDFRLKNADLSRNQDLCHMTDIFFGSSPGKDNFAKFHLCRICLTNFREGDLFGAPSMSRPEKAYPE